MKQIRRSRGHRGYRKPGIFANGGRARQFSNARLLLTIVLVGGGLWVLIWGLNYAKGALP